MICIFPVPHPPNELLGFGVGILNEKIQGAEDLIMWEMSCLVPLLKLGEEPLVLAESAEGPYCLRKEDEKRAWAV